MVSWWQHWNVAVEETVDFHHQSQEFSVVSLASDFLAQFGYALIHVNFHIALPIESVCHAWEFLKSFLLT